MKRLKCLIALCVLLASQVVGLSSASAASDFDSFPVTTDWSLVRVGCSSSVDVHSTWRSILAAGVPAADDQISANGINGGWYIWKRENTENPNSSIIIMVVKAEFIVSEYTISHHLGAGGWLADSGNPWLHTTTEGTRVGDTFDVEISLNSSCEPTATLWGYAGGGYAEYAVYGFPERMGMPVMTGRPYNFQNKMLMAVGNFIAPDGYAGAHVPATYIPPTPEPYSGTVDCFGDDPQYMLIYQAGNDGVATLTYESLGRATWEHDILPNTPYGIVVDCEGTLANSYETVIPFATSGDWVCDPYAVQYDQPYCVLS